MARDLEEGAHRSSGRLNFEDFDRVFHQVFEESSEPGRDLVSMRQAVEEVYQRVRPRARVSDGERNSMADILSRQLPLYLTGEGGMQPLACENLRGGTFVDGGEAFAFKDGGDPLRGIVISRAALNGAIRALKGAG